MSSRPPVDVWDPTYRIKPQVLFIPSQVESIIKEVVDAKIRDHPQFDENVCRVKCQEICKAVMDRAKELNIPRYKLVAQCVMGDVQDQGIITASRCLWNPETDNYATYTFKSSSLFCVVVVYGVYTE